MEKITSVKEWSVAIRLNHWAMALSIFILIVTGFYIATILTTVRPLITKLFKIA